MLGYRILKPLLFRRSRCELGSPVAYTSGGLRLVDANCAAARLIAALDDVLVGAVVDIAGVMSRSLPR